MSNLTEMSSNITEDDEERRDDENIATRPLSPISDTGTGTGIVPLSLQQPVSRFPFERINSPNSHRGHSDKTEKTRNICIRNGTPPSFATTTSTTLPQSKRRVHIRETHNNHNSATTQHKAAKEEEELIVLSGVLTNFGKLVDAQKDYQKALAVCPYDQSSESMSLTSASCTTTTTTVLQKKKNISVNHKTPIQDNDDNDVENRDDEISLIYDDLHNLCAPSPHNANKSTLMLNDGVPHFAHLASQGGFLMNSFTHARAVAEDTTTTMTNALMTTTTMQAMTTCGDIDDTDDMDGDADDTNICSSSTRKMRPKLSVSTVSSSKSLSAPATPSVGSGGDHLAKLAHYSMKCGKYEEARQLFTQALEYYYSEYGNDPQCPQVAHIWMELGRLSAKERRHDEALCYYEKALQIKKSIYANDGSTADGEEVANNDLVATLEALGHIASNLRQYPQALEYYKQSLRMYYAVHNDSWNRDAKVLARKLDTLGKIEYSMGEYDAARIFYTEALHYKGDLYEDNDDEDGGHNKNNEKIDSLAANKDFCASYDALGNVHRILGEYEAANDFFARELALLHEMYGPSTKTREIALVLHNLGNLNCNLHRFQEAQTYYQEALEMKYHCFGLTAKNMSLATTLQSLGILNSELGKYEEAEEFFRKSLEMKYHVYGEDANNACIANTINRYVSSICTIQHRAVYACPYWYMMCSATSTVLFVLCLSWVCSRIQRIVLPLRVFNLF